MYINPAHKFYCEYLKVAKRAFPNLNIADYTVEEIVQKGMGGRYESTFRSIGAICSLINFTYTKDFVLLHYKPYYKLYENWARLDMEGDMWDAWDGLLRYCRGIVFHRHSGEVVINPFNKFFNIDEREECSIERVAQRVRDGIVVEFSEKLDGSLICGRWFNGRLVLSTSTQLDPERSPQLKEAYELIKGRGTLMLFNYRNHTFMFELISKDDPHVVVYDGEDRLVLTGIKSTHNGYSASYDKVRQIGNEWSVPYVRLYRMSLEEVLDSRGDKKAYEAEGYVLNIDGYKVKIKYEDYLNLHGRVSMLNGNHVIKAMADDSLDELKMMCRGKEDFIDSVVSDVSTYIALNEDRVYEAYERTWRASNGEEHEFMKYAQTCIEAPLRGYVIRRYKEGRFDFKPLLKSHSGRYIKYAEIKEYLRRYGERRG